MRIAIANWTRRLVGGAESYLSEAIPAFIEAKVEIAFLSETDLPLDRELIAIPAGTESWCLSDFGRPATLDALARWRPDVIYVHFLDDPILEAQLLTIAPAVLFAHGYHGMCISGEKTFKSPSIAPCSRRFGWECLLQFYPRRCGGLNPITMLHDFSTERARFSLMRKYAAILTASDHMRRELLVHGLSSERVRKTSLPVSTGPWQSKDSWRVERVPDLWRILFAGRMTWLKGGQVLIDALPIVAAELAMPITITFVGDGPARPDWEQRAAHMQRVENLISVQFTGWVDPERIHRILENSDLLVAPSLWPEPFGKAGPEAARAGVPAAAFDVGGISEWLIDGVNGFLTPRASLTAAALARAIVRCLHDPETHRRLCFGARETSRRFDLQSHIDTTLELFRSLIPRPASFDTAGASTLDRPVSSIS